MNIVYGNKQTKLFFDEKNGYLEAIEYNGNKILLHSKLWSIQSVNGEISISDMNRFNAIDYKNILKLFWEGESAKVVVTLKAETEKIRWQINVDLLNGNAINKVQFPIIEGMNFSKENYLLVTWQNGTIIKNPIEALLSKNKQIPFWMGRGKMAYENDYPAGLSFQYGAFYAPEQYGYYFSTEDSEAYIKSYTYQYNSEKNGLDFLLTNYPANMGKASNYCMPYDFVLQLFEGDWQDATKIYRDWAINQKWCSKRLIEKDIPKNVLKTDLWRVNHTNDALGTRTEEYFETSKFLRDFLNCNLALHWYGWNLNEEHDWDTPDYFDDERIKMGWPQKLIEWNKRFDEEGIVKIPYTNARLWERTTKSFQEQNITAAAVKDENGQILNEPWTPVQHLTTICPACAVWQNKVVDMCREFVVDEGFDGAYLDQVGSFNATLCFDETHPHPRGGGFWWNDSYHNMLKNVKKLMGDERFITTESCCETYIDVFDLFLILDMNFRDTGFNGVAGTGIAEEVPLLSMIYGDYALSYGSICRFDDLPERFEYYLMRNTLWGIIPSIEAGDEGQLKDGKQHLASAKRAVDFFKANKELILYGRLCDVPKVYGGEELSIKWDINSEDGNKYSYVDNFSSVYAVIWESSEGKKYLFAYNFSDKLQKAKILEKEYELQGKEFLSVAL